MSENLGVLWYSVPEESDLRLASVKSMYENKIERLENEVKQLKEAANTEIEKAVEKLQKENEDLQAKVSLLVKVETEKGRWVPNIIHYFPKVKPEFYLAH